MSLPAKLVSFPVVVTCALLTFDSGAATIGEIADENQSSYIGVEGAITEGDFDRIVGLAGSFAEQGKPIRLLINSSGGDAVEAMRIGRFVRNSLAQVTIRGAYVKPSSPTLRRCYSACVLILVAAATRDHEMDNEFFTEDGNIIWENADGNRRRKSIPVIGVHRPYFDRDAYSGLTPTEARTTYAGLEKSTREYLREMGAPESFASQMFRYASNEIYLVSKDEFIKIFGYEEPFLEEWFLSKCGGLESREISDYADVLTGRILHNSNSFVPDHLSQGYVTYLEEKEKEVTECKNTLLLEHQRSAIAKARDR